MAGKEMTSTKPSMQNKSVAGGPLALFSKDPMTGHYRDGYCRTGPEDTGKHSVAAQVTKEFLDFTDQNGNNLKASGLKPGMKWCLCVSRWHEAYNAFQKGELGKEGVPQVFLHASDESALKTVTYKSLKEFSAVPEAAKQTNRQASHVNPDSGSGVGGIAHEKTEMAGRKATGI